MSAITVKLADYEKVLNFIVHKYPELKDDADRCRNELSCLIEKTMDKEQNGNTSS